MRRRGLCPISWHDQPVRPDGRERARGLYLDLPLQRAAVLEKSPLATFG